MNKSIRPERVGSLLREEIGIYFQRNFSISEYGIITVTDVVMSADLKIAKVYVSIYGEEKKKQRVLAKLESQIPIIRGMIGRSVRLRYTPEIEFFLDETLDRVMKIENIFNEIHKQKANFDDKEIE